MSREIIEAADRVVGIAGEALDMASAALSRLETATDAIELLYTALRKAEAYQGYPKTGPLSEPATRAALLAGDAILRRAGR